MPAVDDPTGVAASLPGQFALLKAQVKDLSVNRTQSPANLNVGAGGLTVLGATTLTGGVTGPVAATGAVSGSSLSAAPGGNISTSGGGTVYVNGINLANMIFPQTSQTSATGFTLTTSYAAIASFSFTVPAGCTRAMINASGSVSSISSVNDVSYSFVQINGTNGPIGAAGGAAGSVWPAPATAAQNLAGLTAGASIAVTIFGRLTTGPGTSALSLASLAATALFLP